MEFSLSSSALVLLTATYFLGAIPFGLLFAKWLTGKDPREHGSGNIGATNALRTGGKTVGICTLLADIVKGVLPVSLAIYMGFHEFEIACIALTAFLGHIFPVYLKFQGGKGVATMYGVLIPWLPWVAVLSFIIWFITFKSTRFVALASILAGAALPLFAWLLNSSSEAWISCFILASIMIVRHCTNIQRLIAGTEPQTGGEKKG
ncbi:MAG: glycerol-3-phosphate 1-O-acyltransferase PlsY [Mariprofundaceae bacterium]|nr:glycerol-3-phosphate 1-O-acyltransferase PlsY [Mariprofundaceae bacterium]